MGVPDRLGGRPMPRPTFRIACCPCGKPIPTTSDAYALDAEVAPVPAEAA